MINTLQKYLNQSSHRHLELIARTYKIPFTRRELKAFGLEKLSQSLQDGAYEKAFKELNPEHINALQALVIAGHWMPRYLFEQHFGEIRLYRPWRKGFYPPHPWRYPLSIAERLYHLGFIQVHEDMVGIIYEVRHWLPTLTSPEKKAITPAPHETVQTRSALLHDIAVLLGILMQAQAQPVHGRWFSLSVMRQVNQRLTVSDNLSAVRSELQTGRLRWLHYLAQVSGLVSIQNGVFTPTMSAWQWLSADSETQWSSLMQAIEADLSAKHPLWNIFQFPEISAYTWQVLRHTLDDLSPNYSYRVKDILGMLKPYLIEDSTYDIACVLRDVFTWSGVSILKRGRLFVHQVQEPSAQTQTLEFIDNTLRLSLSDKPSVALTTLHAFANVTGNVAIIRGENIREALKQGLDTADILDTLSALTQQTIPNDIQQQIQHWMQEAQSLTLKPMLILHAPDSATISAIRKDWRLAKYFIGRISPNHLLIRPDDSEELLRRLEKRQFPVTSFAKPKKDRRINDTLNQDMAEYLLLAVRTYQKLQSRLGTSIPIPKALTHWLEAQVDASQDIELMSDDLVNAVQKRIPQSYEQIDDGQQDEATIRHVIMQAYRNNLPVTIDYHSPYLDEASTRTIHIRVISDSNDVTYIDAHCELVNDKRQFRLDRILRVHPASSQKIAS